MTDMILGKINDANGEADIKMIAIRMVDLLKGINPEQLNYLSLSMLHRMLKLADPDLTRVRQAADLLSLEDIGVFTPYAFIHDQDGEAHPIDGDDFEESIAQKAFVHPILGVAVPLDHPAVEYCYEAGPTLKDHSLRQGRSRDIPLEV